jgi:hypothetical protein
MTPLQQLIYNYISEHQPICDLCISNAFGYNYNQYANTICRQLEELNHINRTNGKCERCNRNVLLNRVNINE